MPVMGSEEIEIENEGIFEEEKPHSGEHLFSRIMQEIIEEMSIQPALAHGKVKVEAPALEYKVEIFKIKNPEDARRIENLLNLGWKIEGRFKSVKTIMLVFARLKHAEKAEKPV